MRRAQLLAVILAMAAIPVLPGFAADEVFDRMVPLPSGGTLVLENVNGSVTVTGWDRQDVAVHAVKSAATPEELARVQIDVAAAPGRVAVNTVYPPGEAAEVTVTYSLRVPRRVLLGQVATVNGAVRVSGVEGAGELRSVNGDVGVSDSSGGFSARTTNGDIHMEFARLASAGPLTIETVNGSIGLALPPSASAALDVRCWNGDFHSDLPMSQVTAYRPREFQGRLGDGGTPVQLRTVNGAIRILALTQGI